MELGSKCTVARPQLWGSNLKSKMVRRTQLTLGLKSPRDLRGVPRWRDRFPQYGIKVSYWGSGTLKIVPPLKIVIPVENHSQKPENRLGYYHPLWVWGC